MGRTATKILVTAAGIGAALMGVGLVGAKGARADRLNDLRARTPEQEIVYFVLPDRFATGDLKGLTVRLDYVQELGATAIWFAPIFKNKPVQDGKGQESAGYHGYWVTDFTTVDPHFGTDADFRALLGTCPSVPTAPDSLALSLPAFGYAVCAAKP